MAEPSVSVQRHEWPRPGDLFHVESKPLERSGCVGHLIYGASPLAHVDDLAYRLAREATATMSTPKFLQGVEKAAQFASEVI